MFSHGNLFGEQSAFFYWLVSLDKVLTADNYKKRGVVVVDWCYVCKKDGESVNHLFLHCDVANGMRCEFCD